MLYVGCSISRISIIDISRGIWPMLLMYVAILFALILFPEIVTYPLSILHNG